MAYAETTGSALGATKVQTSELIGVWDGGNESSTPQFIKAGSMVSIFVDWTSGTLTVQMAPIGTTMWVPYFVDGAATIAADKVVSVFAAQDCLMRVTGATAVATVNIQKS